MKTFENYLSDQCPDEYVTNNSPEGEERWLEQLDLEEILDFADEYAAQEYKRGYVTGGMDTINEKNSLASNIN